MKNKLLLFGIVAFALGMNFISVVDWFFPPIYKIGVVFSAFCWIPVCFLCARNVYFKIQTQNKKKDEIFLLAQSLCDYTNKINQVSNGDTSQKIISEIKKIVNEQN